MTDREIIKTELGRLKTELIEEGENTMFEQGRISAFEDMEVFIDSLQEEPVSDDLEIAAYQSFNCACEDLNKEDKDSATYVKEYFKELWMCAFKDGAHWKEQLMIKKSIEVKVKSDKDGLFTTETWDEMNELLQKIGAKEGDKVYISIIKQEEK